MSIDFTLIFYSIGIPFIYLWLLYGFSQKNLIEKSDLVKAVFLGFISTIFTTYSYAAFPVEWYELDMFERYFYQVAVREELSKFFAFLLLINFSIKRKLKPIALMYLCGIVGFGFGVQENMIYYHRYGIDTLFSRNFTSLLAHTIFGMFTGYWFALGKSKLKEINNISLAKYQPYFYTAIGLLSSIAFHGLWNYNLGSSGWAAESIMYLMMVLGLLVIGIYNNNLKNIK